MVLDGQQRLQSLLLATQGEDSGFRLTDFEWLEDAGERPRSNTRKYWSWGQLCLDADTFLDELAKSPHSVMQVDYRQILTWVVYSTDQGVSPDRPPEYQGPVELYRQGRHIRFSKLWQLARDQWFAESYYRERLGKLLEELEVPGEKRAELRDRLAELLSVMGGLKETEVSCLIVRALLRDATEQEREQYDDAVVNIFTRLNTGGTRLTAQEVLFAWIKRKWNPVLTSHASADKCFETLQAELKEGAIDLSLDDLVRGVAAVWSALANEGVLLTERQFRLGADLGSVAPWMAERWDRIARDAVSFAHLLGALGLQQGRHFESLNSVYTCWAWRFVASEWAKQKADKEMVREAVARAIEDHSRRLLARWMLIPQWAGRWQEARSFQDYIKDLGRLWHEIKTTGEWEHAVALWKDMMESWITDARVAAAKFVSEVHAGRRNTVRRYYSLLWAWQNLDAERSRLARINLEMRGRGAMETDVDHVVAYKQWETEFAKALAPGEDIDEIPDGANAMGNCLLLAKNFNISKKAKPLKLLLDEVYDFRWDRERLADFCEALVLDEKLLDATNRPVAEVRAAVAARSERIRTDLLRFVGGQEDLQEADAEALPRLGPWHGIWTIEITAGKSGGSDWSGPMRLQQDGERLTGTYGSGWTVEATVYKDVVEGEWSELPADNGRFKWWLIDDGGAFDGTRGRRSHRRGGGEWRGKRTAKSD
jgi:hypothetical protein